MNRECDTYQASSLGNVTGLLRVKKKAPDEEIKVKNCTDNSSSKSIIQSLIYLVSFDRDQRKEMCGIQGSQSSELQDLCVCVQVASTSRREQFIKSMENSPRDIKTVCTYQPDKGGNGNRANNLI